jgi:hypothetical protein
MDHAMIMTRRFGALRARRVFPSVVQEQAVTLDERHDEDIRLQERHSAEVRESAA